MQICDVLRAILPWPLSPRHQELEVTAFVGAGNLFGEQLGVAALGDILFCRRRSCALSQLRVIDFQFDAAIFHRKPDAIAIAHPGERAA